MSRASCQSLKFISEAPVIGSHICFSRAQSASFSWVPKFRRVRCCLAPLAVGRRCSPRLWRLRLRCPSWRWLARSLWRSSEVGIAGAGVGPPASVRAAELVRRGDRTLQVAMFRQGWVTVFEATSTWWPGGFRRMRLPGWPPWLPPQWAARALLPPPVCLLVPCFLQASAQPACGAFSRKPGPGPPALCTLMRLTLWARSALPACPASPTRRRSRLSTSFWWRWMVSAHCQCPLGWEVLGGPCCSCLRLQIVCGTHRCLFSCRWSAVSPAQHLPQVRMRSSESCPSRSQLETRPAQEVPPVLSLHLGNTAFHFKAEEW